MKKNTIHNTVYSKTVVYHLYNLTYEEAKIIEPGFKKEDFEEYKIADER